MPLGAFKAALMGTAGVSTGDVVLLSSQTATSDASITFSSGIDSTYGEYIFKFYNMNPETEGGLVVGFNATDGADYNDSPITSTWFWAYHGEDDATPALAYRTDMDQAQGTGYHNLSANTGIGADESIAGEMHLFNPAGTTYVKHFYGVTQSYSGDDVSQQTFSAGYINDTTAIDDVQFKMAGDFDGTIKMWGVK